MASDWLYSIETAIYLFPVLAMVMTLPFMVYNYRRYGSIPFMRFLCIYLFVFYMLCVYFLVILPLPPIEEVAKLTTPYLNLKLFKDVEKIVSLEPVMPENWQGWVAFLKNWAGLEPVCNVIMLIPFGFFLRYYFKRGFWQTLLFSLLLSVFFELTQLSGLYGIYPRPYRYVDVNDLFNNTLGGCIGWLVVPLFAWLLPTRDEIDRNAYKNASANTYTRRLIALLIDWMIGTIVVSLVEHWIYDRYWEIVSSALRVVLFTLIPYFWHGNTPGKRLLGIRLGRIKSEKRPPMLDLFFRAAFVHGWLLGGAMFPDRLVPDAAMLPGTEIPMLVLAWGAAFLTWTGMAIDMLYRAKQGNRILIYERFTRICNKELKERG
ncbi:MAG: VanZ family protein [Lachnospiraceae bacterium]|nr:VanZ family protein [Lachnospiraceae bacterium]